MSKPNKRNINVLTSEELTGIKLSKPPSYAAGVTGVKVAMEHAISEMGAIRAFQTLAKMNQKGGFDCPGCAWPDPDDKRSVLGEYCENGAKALAEEATLKRVKPDFFAQYSVEEISNWSDFKIGRSGRLTHPMILEENATHYKPISWEDAFALIGKQLKALDSPDEGIFYTSGRSSNEAAFLYGLFARAFGTNNMPDCSNMCHESSGVALSQTVGIGKGSVTLDDLYKAEVVMVIGQNPGTNHPRMLSALQKCKQNGGSIINVNPLSEAGLKKFKNPQHVGDYFTGGTALTDVFLQVKINQDVPLLKAIMKKLALLEDENGNVFDKKFIAEQTQGFEEMMAELDGHILSDLVTQSGVEEAEIDKAVQLLATKKRIIICWAMGLTQHKNGVENIKECVNLLLAKGSIGIEGGGTCPVRGHSNVQGDRTVGIVEKTSKELSDAIGKSFGFTPPSKHGYDVVHCVQAMHRGDAKIFVALGGNFVSAVSDTEYTAEALQHCELTVSVSTKLNRTHLVPGRVSLILPTLGRSEKDIKNGKRRFVTVENSMGKVHSSEGSLEPSSEHLMSEPDIVANIATAYFGDNHLVNWQGMATDYGLIRDKISEVIGGFENYNERVKDGNDFYLPNNAREGDFSKLPNGKAQFSVCGLPEHDLKLDEFLLMTIRSHDQYNTTIYGLNDRYRGIEGERRVVLMNEKDMNRLGLNKLDLVNLTSEYDGKVRRANTFYAVPYDIPKGNLACYFPEANTLIPINQFAKQSHTPISKSVKVRIERA
ncbi:MAG: molybdopterin-dependent oxidoreductase alpha subunit [Saprospiraceae bacterium]|jgi:molybdopterin-dependent oxidoreductase alpha subunit